MKNNLFFCVDLGTSSLKAALIDSSGSLHAFARVFKEGTGAVSWLRAFHTAVEQLSAACAEAAAGPAAALVISGSGPTLIPVTGEDPEASETLRPLYWFDPAPRLPGCSSLFLPKVKAFMETDPASFAGTRYLFSTQEWLLWKLGARPVTILPHKAYLPYYWNEEQCANFGIDRNRLPPFVNMGEVIGELNPTALSAVFNKTDCAAKLLTPGTPLVAGGADFIMALIGTGTLEPGMVCDRTGSSEGINICLTEEDIRRRSTTATAEKRGAVTEPSAENVLPGELRTLPHAIEGLWNLGAVIPRSGMLFDEYRVSSGQDGRPYNELVAEILEAPTGTEFAHTGPTQHGPAQHGRTHPGRPILETMGKAFVKALDDLETSGYTIKELTLSGGQCADPRWNQYKADLSGRTLKVPEIIHAELTGNAILAAAALEGGSIREKAAAMIRIKEQYIPHRISQD